jgi:hypothetical protein
VSKGRSARQPRVQLPLMFSLDSRLLSIASFSTTGARHLRTNHTPSLPAFPLYILSFSFLSCFGNDDQHLAAAAQHQYALNRVLSLFLSILLILFLTFSCSSGATTTRIPSPKQHRTFITTGFDCSVGPTQNVFKLPPFKDGIIVTFQYQSHRVFSLLCLSRAFGLRRLLSPALALVESPSILCPLSTCLSRVSSLVPPLCSVPIKSLSPHLILDDKPISEPLP